MAKIPEYPNFFEGSNEDHEKESVSRPPLLDAFLQPFHDPSDITEWTFTMQERTRPYFEKFNRIFDDQITLVATTLEGFSYINGIYKRELYNSQQTEEQLRELSIQIMLLGYEGGKEADWERIVPEVVTKLTSHPYVNPKLFSWGTMLGRLDAFVSSCIVAGAHFHEQVKNIPSIPQKSQSAPKPERNPGAWGAFIEGLDLDDFTGKRN